MIQTTWGSVVTDYVVNGLGQRVRKTVNSGPLAGTTYYFYDEEGHLLGEYDGSGNLIQEYVWDGDTPVAVIRGPVSNPQIYSIETDHLGTPRQIRDASATVRWEWDPDPFDNAAPSDNPSGLGVFTMNLRFPGQYFDKETNLHYNYFRDYDPAIGRYIQSDPVGLSGGINTYAYVDGNPLTRSDPMGLESIGQVWNGTRWVYPPNSPWAPSTNTQYCATAECAAGVLPARPELRTQSEIDESTCRLGCNLSIGTACAAASVRGGFAGVLACRAAVIAACYEGCKQKYCK